MKFPHIHRHRKAGYYGLMALPFYECRCGSRRWGTMW